MTPSLSSRLRVFFWGGMGEHATEEELMDVAREIVQVLPGRWTDDLSHQPWSDEIELGEPEQQRGADSWVERAQVSASLHPFEETGEAIDVLKDRRYEVTREGALRIEELTLHD